MQALKKVSEQGENRLYGEENSEGAGFFFYK